jgi:hypothetical protein
MRPGRYGAHMRAASLIVIAVLVGAGCGSETEPADEPAPADEVSAELEITFWPNGRGSGNAQTWTLTCDPPGGTHPMAADACARLAALENPFAPPPPDEICTEQYGGPEEALVEGTFRGEAVSYGLARTNGCEIARFDQYRFLIPGSAAG